MKKKFKFPLAYQILVGLILGIIVGAIFYGNPAVETYLQPLGTIFINMIKMIVVPIIVSTLIVGVAGTGDLKQLGKLGGKTMIYFQVVSTIAIIVGLLRQIFSNRVKASICRHLRKGISINMFKRLKKYKDHGPWIFLSVLYRVILFNRWQMGICLRLSSFPCYSV